ncbi:conserved hypothetical protein [Opitutus terrae PB90-1]|uniref:Glycosyltransferase RgtA/B/C/D-like domain-containing protein n=1 Tax=Opitutus terrae (strain DSM 11246 / JCM 15787 / PB90-1) TaxID=452637 RepID=B1ZZU6_OPITP|nr:conserved hypothetical protein [Opitutus terrae PB90-1]
MSRRPLGLLALCLAVALGGCVWAAWDMFGPQRRPMLQGWDDSHYYAWLPSVLIDRDLDFANQLIGHGTLPASAEAEVLAQPRTATGLLPNKYPPGWAFGSLPFFLVAHALAPPDASGYEPVYLMAVWLGQLLYAAGGLWLAVQILARFFPLRVATVATCASWLASPLLYYQSARLSLSHSQVFALAMLTLWLALRLWDGDQRARLWLLLGFASALLVVTRNVAVVYLAWPAWVLVRRLRTASAAGWLLAGAAAPVLVQVLAWKLLYGSWLVYSYGGEKFDFAQLHLVDVLASPRHGWFYWHPLLVGGVVAFAGWAWRRSEGRGWLLSLALIVVLNAAWPTWWLGSSFGHRGFEVATLFAAVGLATILQACRDRLGLQRAVASIIAIAIIWNLALLALFLTHRIPREGPVTYVEMARALASWPAP